MLKHVIAFSIRHASLVLFSAGLLMVAVGLLLPRMSVDVFPELNAPTVVVMAEAGGLSADEVEQYVTVFVEARVLGLPGVRRVRSASATSLGMVWVEFDWGYDIYRARQLVTEQMTMIAEEVPSNVHLEVAPISSIAGEIMLVALSAPDGSVTPLELRAFAEYEARNRLLAVPGVSQVVAIGGELPELQVAVTQEQLALHDLTLADVVAAARRCHSTASAGYLAEHEGLELPIRQSARVQGAEQVRDTVIRMHEGRPLTIGDVAEVRMRGAPRRGTAADAGDWAVVLSIQKAPGTNTLALTEEVDRALDDIEAAMPAGAVLNREVFRQSRFINTAVDNVVHVLLEAIVFVALVIVLFLLNARTTLITLTALPLSLAVAFLVLWVWDLSINVMTLGGLAVAIGELVDDAIIDVENVFRRLRENWLLPPEARQPDVAVIYRASNEIRSSIVFATIIIALVFVPLLFLQGLEGRFFQPLGIAYIVAILASLVVALTVIPALCRFLLVARRERKPSAHRDGFLVRFLKWIYRPTLRLALRLRLLVLPLGFAATLGALALASTYGTSFLPQFNEGTLTVFLMAPPGTSLDESDRLARGIEQRIVEVDGVATVVRRTGRAERDEHAEPPSLSEVDVTLESNADPARVRAEIDAILTEVPGISTMIGQPIEHRLSHILSGTPAAIAINVYGDDLDRLRQLAQRIERELRTLPGARDVNANREMLVTSIPIEYRHAELARYGLAPADAADQVSAAFYGETVARVNVGVRRFDVVVRLAEAERERPEHLAQFMLRGQDGAYVRLHEVATIGLDQTSNLVMRENAQRKAVVSLNVAEGHNLGHLVEQVRERVDRLVAEQGYAVTYGGQFEAQQSAATTILWMGLGVSLLILMLLVTVLRTLRASLLVMVNLPLALIGGVVAIFLAESPDAWRNAVALFGHGNYVAPVISIASMVGFVTLFGIAVRNGILLANHYRNLILDEALSVREAVLRGSEERLVPILMTAITAMLGLVPLALRAGQPGSELLAPLAIVVLGGLVTSTLLNLVIVPAGYLLLFGKGYPVESTALDPRHVDDAHPLSKPPTPAPAEDAGTGSTSAIAPSESQSSTPLTPNDYAATSAAESKPTESSDES